MSRFDHLEISDQTPEFEDIESRDSGIRDEDYYKEQADIAFASEDYERALAYYSRALQYDSSLEDCWFGQLRCLIDIGELREAVIWAQRALEKFPKSAPMLAATAVAESRAGRIAVAMGYSDGSFAVPGVTAYCWIARGEVLLGQTPASSKACFTKAIELAPNDWSVYAAIGHAYRLRNCIPDAQIYFKQAVRLNAELFICWYWIGKCSESLRDFEEAISAYRRVLAMRPNFERAQNAIDEIKNRGFFSRFAGAMRQAFRGR